MIGSELELEAYNALPLEKKIALHHEWIETIGEKGRRLSLDEIDMRAIDLSVVKIELSYLAACFFDGMLIEDVDMYMSEMYSSTFRGAVLRRCDFTKAELSYADFSGAKLIDVRFNRTWAHDTTFRRCTFVRCSIGGLHLIESDLSDCTFEDVDLSDLMTSRSLFAGSSFIRPKGLDDTLRCAEMNVGTVDEPVLLSGDGAIAWIRGHSIGA